MKIFFVILLLCSQFEAAACECFYYKTEEVSNLEYEIKHNDWIGIGTIIKANKDIYPVIYEIETRILYKGSNEITKIETGRGGMDCGFLFEVGEEYIIYGFKKDNNTIITTSCSRTNKINDSIDFDYLNKEFKDSQINLDWSESIANFVQVKIENQIEIENPPLLINEDYKLISVEELIVKHPNYYTAQKIVFSSKDYKKMHPDLRAIMRKNGIILIKAFSSKIKNRKLIKKLNKQFE